MYHHDEPDYNHIYDSSTSMTGAHKSFDTSHVMRGTQRARTLSRLQLAICGCGCGSHTHTNSRQSLDTLHASVCVRACMRVCVHACTRRACVHGCMCSCVRECVRARACILACMHACMRARMRACVHGERVCMVACVCVSTCVCERGCERLCERLCERVCERMCERVDGGWYDCGPVARAGASTLQTVSIGILLPSITVKAVTLRFRWAPAVQAFLTVPIQICVPVLRLTPTEALTSTLCYLPHPYPGGFHAVAASIHIDWA